MVVIVATVDRSGGLVEGKVIDSSSSIAGDFSIVECIRKMGGALTVGSKDKFYAGDVMFPFIKPE